MNAECRMLNDWSLWPQFIIHHSAFIITPLPSPLSSLPSPPMPAVHQQTGGQHNGQEDEADQREVGHFAALPGGTVDRAENRRRQQPGELRHWPHHVYEPSGNHQPVETHLERGNASVCDQYSRPLDRRHARFSQDGVHHQSDDSVFPCETLIARKMR